MVARVLDSVKLKGSQQLFVQVSQGYSIAEGLTYRKCVGCFCQIHMAADAVSLGTTLNMGKDKVWVMRHAGPVVVCFRPGQARRTPSLNYEAVQLLGSPPSNFLLMCAGLPGVVRDSVVSTSTIVRAYP
jgi:hypothetical protein